MKKSNYGDTVSRVPAGAGSFSHVWNYRSQGDGRIEGKPEKVPACGLKSVN